MSKKNRQYTYNKLIAEGRFKDISKALIKEFGEPKKPKAPEEPETPKAPEPPKETKPKGKK